MHVCARRKARNTEGAGAWVRPVPPVDVEREFVPSERSAWRMAQAPLQNGSAPPA